MPSQKGTKRLRTTIQAALRNKAPRRPKTFTTQAVLTWISGEPASRYATPKRVAYVLQEFCDKKGMARSTTYARKWDMGAAWVLKRGVKP